MIRLYMLLLWCCATLATAWAQTKPTTPKSTPPKSTTTTKPKPSKPKLETIYTETYTGFNNGELGDCLQENDNCKPIFTQMLPLTNMDKLSELLYKRICYDSARLHIAREYVRDGDSMFIVAQYSPDKRLLHYGRLYLRYRKPVIDTMYGYDSLYNRVPQQLLKVQPIEILKTGHWQETTPSGIRAGYYVNDEPVGSWKFFSLPVLADLDLPSQLWQFKNGKLVQSDTVNFLERKPLLSDVRRALVGQWANFWENDKIVLMTKGLKKMPVEIWTFADDGTIKVEAIFNYGSKKDYAGTWSLDESLKLAVDVPNFTTTTLELRFLDKNRLLFFK